MIGTAGMPVTPDADSEMLVNQLDASTGWPKLFSAASQRTHRGSKAAHRTRSRAHARGNRQGVLQ